MAKSETVEEFLARGGAITKCPIVEKQEKQQSIKSMAVGPVTILSLGEADLFYGEKSTRKKKEKAPNLSGIDISQIPDDLKKSLGL